MAFCSSQMWLVPALLVAALQRGGASLYRKARSDLYYTSRYGNNYGGPGTWDSRAGSGVASFAWDSPGCSRCGSPVARDPEYRGNGYDNLSPEWALRMGNKGGWTKGDSGYRGSWSGSIRPVDPGWGAEKPQNHEGWSTTHRGWNSGFGNRGWSNQVPPSASGGGVLNWVGGAPGHDLHSKGVGGWGSTGPGWSSAGTGGSDSWSNLGGGGYASGWSYNQPRDPSAWSGKTPTSQWSYSMPRDPISAQWDLNRPGNPTWNQGGTWGLSGAGWNQGVPGSSWSQTGNPGGSWSQTGSPGGTWSQTGSPGGSWNKGGSWTQSGGSTWSSPPTGGGWSQTQSQGSAWNQIPSHGTGWSQTPPQGSVWNQLPSSGSGWSQGLGWNNIPIHGWSQGSSQGQPPSGWDQGTAGPGWSSGSKGQSSGAPSYGGWNQGSSGWNQGSSKTWSQQPTGWSQSPPGSSWSQDSWGQGPSASGHVGSWTQGSWNERPHSSGHHGAHEKTEHTKWNYALPTTPPTGPSWSYNDHSRPPWASGHKDNCPPYRHDHSPSGTRTDGYGYNYGDDRGSYPSSSEARPAYNGHSGVGADVEYPEPYHRRANSTTETATPSSLTSTSEA